MRFVFLGPPGVGKGTQAARFSERHKLPHIATGDLLRVAMKEDTSVGLKAKSFIEKGRLVPDEVIIALMEDRIQAPDAKSGYILDGFPRTIAQAKALSEILIRNGIALDRVFYFSLGDETLMERIVGRRTCPDCHAIYHVSYYPPEKEGLCHCGGVLFQRKDDVPETVAERLAVYKDETSPLITYYKNEHILTEINADQSVERIAENLQKVI